MGEGGGEVVVRRVLKSFFIFLLNHISYCSKEFFNPLTPVPPMMRLGLSSTSDVITFDQNWHHLYSTSAGGKDLHNDARSE